MLQRNENIQKEILEVAIKSILFALVAGTLTILTHMLSDMYIFHTHGNPEIANTMLVIYTSMDKMLIAIAYYVLGRKIPIKNTVLRGIIFIWLNMFSNYIPQVMGLAFADGEIAEKSFSLPIILCDVIVYTLLGVVLGIIYKKDSTFELRKCEKKAFVKAIVISAIIFPLLVTIADQTIYHVYPDFSSACVIDVSEKMRLAFFINFYCWFILAGALIAVFYRFTEYNDKGSFLSFALKYGLLLWTPVVMIMVMFGTELISTIAYSVIFMGIITLVSYINSKLIK